MKHRYLIPILCMLFAGSVQSQSAFWRDPSGKPVPETESMKSKSGFAGSLLATIDEDWKQKWSTPPETKPYFNKAEVVPYGKKVFILTFFSNPLKDANGNANVKCDLKVSDPKGKASLEQRDMVCFSGRLADSSYNLYLSAPVIAFSGDPGDLPGTWVVNVNLRDENRNVALPLRTTFQLK